MNSSKDGFANGVTLDELRDHAQRADREALSALMDDEASELEVRRVVRRLPEQPDLLATWKRYQVIKAAIHESVPVRGDVDLLSGINAALADESVPSAGNRYANKWVRFAGQAAIAASVAVFAVFGVSSLDVGQSGSSNAQPQLAGEYNPSGLERTVRLDNAARTRLQQAVYQFSSTPRSSLEQPMPAAPLILELELQRDKLPATALE